MCVWKIKGVQRVREHFVYRHLRFIVCVKMEGVVHDTLIEHGVDR